MAGGAADCQFWHRNLGIKCRLHELANKRDHFSYRSIKAVGKHSVLLPWNGVLDYIMWTVKEEGSPYAYGVLDNGCVLFPQYFTLPNVFLKFVEGNNDFCIFDLISHEIDWNYRYDMSIEEAAELARRSIYHATFRDGASGGVASVYYVGPDGWKKLSGDDVGELHYHYYPVMPSTVEQEMVEVTGA
ncbi:proteasome subunit beta type-5-like [Castanea sativa]|uniref:proteasome subunit beta type-5-like n=1 Tax=Castanea sativa TaxID=21020 RepID=UPI003F6536C2